MSRLCALVSCQPHCGLTQIDLLGFSICCFSKKSPPWGALHLVLRRPPGSLLVQTHLWTQLARSCCPSWKATWPSGWDWGLCRGSSLVPADNSQVTLSKINQGVISRDLRFSSCKMEILIACTSQDWGVHSNDLIKKSLPNLISWSFSLVSFQEFYI